MISLENDFSHSTDIKLGLNPLNVLEATDTNSETSNNLSLSEPLSLMAEVKVSLSTTPRQSFRKLETNQSQALF